MLEKSFLWTTFEKWLFYISDQINYYKEHGLKSGPEKISPWVSHLGKNSEGWQRATHMLETNKSHYSIIIQPIEQISHEILLLLVISLKKQDLRMKKQRKVGPEGKQISCIWIAYGPLLYQCVLCMFLLQPHSFLTLASLL